MFFLNSCSLMFDLVDRHPTSSISYLYPKTSLDGSFMHFVFSLVMSFPSSMGKRSKCYCSIFGTTSTTTAASVSKTHWNTFSLSPPILRAWQRCFAAPWPFSLVKGDGPMKRLRRRLRVDVKQRDVGIVKRNVFSFHIKLSYHVLEPAPTH